MVNRDMENYVTFAFASTNLISISKDYSFGLRLQCSSSTEIYKILSTYSLVELRDFLSLFIPLASCFNKDKTPLLNLKTAIEFIERDIYVAK